MEKLELAPQDLEARVRALEEDLEYYRTKRLEPRIFHMARKGIVTFYDILKAKSSIAIDPSRVRDEKGDDLEAHITALEEGLNYYIKGIGLLFLSDLLKGVDLVIEDARREGGSYDEFFRIAKKEHHGGIEERIEGLNQDLKDYRSLLDAFTQALIMKGLISASELGKKREGRYTAMVLNGARIVARAWMDAEFKARLIAEGREAIRELDLPPGRIGKLAVVENTESVHNVVVCTLCSCYPYELLGNNPWWYKHDSYKKNIIADPRGTLKEMFGLKIPSNIEVRVHDSTSDVRYMVIPRRPKGTEGMREEELAKLVTADSLIGVAEPLQRSRGSEDRKN